jgi:acetyl-CoA acetyltransferase
LTREDAAIRGHAPARFTHTRRALRRRANRNVVAPTSLAGQFEQPYGPMGPPTLFTIPVLRYMKTYGLSHETLAMVSAVQREWAVKNPCATFKTPITVTDMPSSKRMTLKSPSSHEIISAQYENLCGVGA